MGFWDNVNSELKNAVEEGWSAVKESAKVGKLRFQVHNLQKKAEGLFAKIGGVVYETARMEGYNPLSNVDVRKAIEEIKKIESEIALLQAEISNIKKKEATNPR